jgi:hypothetical protein
MKQGFEAFFQSGNLYASTFLTSSGYQLQISKKDIFTPPDFIYYFKGSINTVFNTVKMKS